MKLSLCYDEVTQHRWFPMGAHGFVLICKLTTAYNCDCDVILTLQSLGNVNAFILFTVSLSCFARNIDIHLNKNSYTSTQVFVCFFVKKVSS